MDRSPFSDFLHQRRQALGRQWGDILAAAYLSRATLHRIRHGDPHHPIAEVSSLRALSHALKFGSWDDLMAAYEANDVRAGLGLEMNNGGTSYSTGRREDDAVLALSKALDLAPTEIVRRLARVADAGPDDPLPPSLRMNEMRPARMVPHFVTGVAASRLVEKLEEEDFDSKQPVSIEDARVFTIPVDGDCQEPVWKHGEIVVFSFDAYDREGILPGKSYYLAFTDGSTTFKRVFLDPDDPEVYLLRCWNEKKYGRQRRIHFRDVVRIARAISKQVVPEE
jgi:hypothetical protein